MTDFCIQIHTDRAPGLDLAAVRSACDALAQNKALVRCFAVIDKGCGDHVNFMFATHDARALWRALTASLFENHALGPAIRKCAMVMCQGAQGWDDYRVLHHFDPRHPVDPLP
jgi:hypothetical protein